MFAKNAFNIQSVKIELLSQHNQTKSLGHQESHVWIKDTFEYLSTVWEFWQSQEKGESL